MTSQQEALDHVKNEINESISNIEKQNPKLAKYLRDNIVYDEVKCTVMYTGDDRVTMNRILK